MLESQIKKKCKKKLEDWGWFVIHLIQTNKNGIPDTLILRNGEAIFIEFKRPGKLPGELQKYRMDKFSEYGFKSIIVQSVKNIEHLK